MIEKILVEMEKVVEVKEDIILLLTKTGSVIFLKKEQYKKLKAKQPEINCPVHQCGGKLIKMEDDQTAHFRCDNCANGWYMQGCEDDKRLIEQGKADERKQLLDELEDKIDFNNITSITDVRGWIAKKRKEE